MEYKVAITRGGLKTGCLTFQAGSFLQPEPTNCLSWAKNGLAHAK